MDEHYEEMLRFQVHRNIKILYKGFLEILEDLGHEHDEALVKLVEALPTEYKVYVDLADHFTAQKGEVLRKKILDAGNNSIRNIEEELKKFSIKIKE